MRPINPGRSARGKRAYTETHVNSAGAIRVTNIGANNAVAQNLQLDADEFDAVVADLIRRGAGIGAGTKITAAMRAMGVLDQGEDERPETVQPAMREEQTIEQVLEHAESVIFSSPSNLERFVEIIGKERFYEILKVCGGGMGSWQEDQTKIEELERQLADIKEGQARTTADAEADEDEETYFKRIVESIAETPSYLKMLNDALADRGMITTGLAGVGDGQGDDSEPKREDPGAAAYAGLATLAPEATQVDLTTLADGGQQIAIRIQPDGEPADRLIAQYLEFCKDRGIPVKKRIQRAAPAKKSSSG